MHHLVGVAVYSDATALASYYSDRRAESYLALKLHGCHKEVALFVFEYVYSFYGRTDQLIAGSQLELDLDAHRSAGYSRAGDPGIVPPWTYSPGGSAIHDVPSLHTTTMTSLSAVVRTVVADTGLGSVSV